jgi:hypothetical protein
VQSTPPACYTFQGDMPDAALPFQSSQVPSEEGMTDVVLSP